ncbi:LptF/LptG family permease [Paradesertivirga mongoliensis]|uniref:LptF/LptG family permease n=1 Tax=Paradesertivirga mongoliensis TaxID=2100740 RepID=A0ABW4ZKN6_9SPHI|nr:LptF/LptG family permease [Pedobacter mongoliensis]
MLKIRLLDWYIIKKYLGTFVFTMVIFSVIIVVFDISERLDDFIKYDAPVSKIIFQYYAGFVPFYLNFLSPLINFIAVIFFTAKMADQTEIVPILSGGVSFYRFLWPYFISSFVIFFVTLVFNIFIIPETNQLMVEFENVYIDPETDNTKMYTHLQLNKNTYVYIENFDNNQKVGYRFSLEKFNGDELVEKTVADRILWDSVKHKWKLENFSVRKVRGLKENMISGASKDTSLDMRPVDFEIYDNLTKAMNMQELNTRIEKEKIRGAGIMDELLLEKYRRFIYPFSAFVLTLMGVALSSRKVRGGIGLPLGIGIFLSFTYIVFIQFSNMFCLKGGLPPIIAVLIPNIAFGLLGVYLLIKAPK